MSFFHCIIAEQLEPCVSGWFLLLMPVFHKSHVLVWCISRLRRACRSVLFYLVVPNSPFIELTVR